MHVLLRIVYGRNIQNIRNVYSHNLFAPAERFSKISEKNDR